MFRTRVNDDGTIRLGADARALGFAPGQAVQVIATAAGSLMLALDDDWSVDVPYAVLAPRPALAGEMARGRAS